MTHYWSSRGARWPAGRLLAAAVVAGVAWGVAARAWMRLVTAEAEFTWSGSVFVVIAYAVCLVAQAVAHVAGRRQTRWRRPLAGVISWIGVLFVAPGPGMATLPGLVAAPIAAGPTRRPATRVVAAVVLGADLVLLLLLMREGLAWPRIAAGWVAMVVLYSPLVAARVVVRRQSWTGAPLGWRRGAVLAVAGAGAVGVVVLAMAGA